MMIIDNGNNRYFGQYVGSFNHNWNNIITGDVYFVNKHTLFLYNFSFNGQESGKRYTLYKFFFPFFFHCT